MRKRNLGTEYERLDVKRIFRAHNGLCQICGFSIDPGIPWPGRLSLEYDHRVPVMAGGGHTYENVVPTHSMCNARKRLRLDPFTRAEWIRLAGQVLDEKHGI